MADDLIFVSRITRLPLLDLDDTPLGRIEDVILLPHHDDEAPWVVGFVGRVQRRKIFVNANRIASLDARGVQLRSASVNLRRFEQRPGEILTSGLLNGRRVGDLLVRDVGLRRVGGAYPGWEVAELIVGGGGPIPLRRRPVRTLSWTLAPDLFDIGPTAREAAALTDLHPSEGAKRLRALPRQRRNELVRAMEEEDLAHLLEELPEPEQVQLLAALDLEQAVAVLAAMAPDDAADLLAELPERRARRAPRGNGRRGSRVAATPAGARPAHRRRVDEPRAGDRRGQRARGRGPGQAARPRPGRPAGHAGLRRRAARRHPDRTLPRVRRIPAAVARAPVAPRRSVPRRG